MRMLQGVPFWSCWLHAKEEDRKSFASLLEVRLKGRPRMSPQIGALIELADRADSSIPIDPKLVASHVPSPQLGLYLIQRECLSGDAALELIDLHMTLSLKLGYCTSLRAIFDEVRTRLGPAGQAKWLTALGDWESVLNIYQQTNAPVRNILTCLRNLGRAREVLKCEKIFLTQTPDETDECANTFMWTYFHMGQNEKCEELISWFPEREWRPMRYLFTIFYSLLTGRLEEAEQHIRFRFRQLASQKVL
jgi:hypothetical protein